MAIKRAKRESLKLKLGVSGPSGSGKTYSSLLLGRGLIGNWDDIAVLDSEQSCELYSDLGEYGVIPFKAPFSPQRYMDAIDYAIKEGVGCLIVDSVSHEWDGEGGCLDIQAKLGGRFQDWAKVTPMHRAFIDKIVQAPIHIICCNRTKTDYSVEVNNGKSQVRKLGTKEIQREGWEYEMSLALNINIEHYATASKDRTGLFMDQPPFKISVQTGEMLKAWNEGTLNKNEFKNKGE